MEGRLGGTAELGLAGRHVHARMLEDQETIMPFRDRRSLSELQ